MSYKKTKSKKEVSIEGLSLVNETDRIINIDGIGQLIKGHLTLVPEELASQIRQDRKSLEKMGVSVLDVPTKSEG